MTSTRGKSVFLDVDSSIVESNLRFAKDPAEEEFTKMFGEAPCYPSKLVQPTPGFCVKTKEIGSDTKVFVNVCKTDGIPPPKDITPSELRDIIESEEPGEYKVPMSIGEVRTEKDKKGQVVKVIDVAIHPSFFNKVENLETFKNFFIAVVFHGLEDKYGLVVADEKILLRNKKAFGTLQQHRIQQREIDQKMAEVSGQKSLISELKGETPMEQKKVLIEALPSTENKKRSPEYRLYKKKDGKNVLYGEFRLPDIISAKEITLDIGEDRIVLESKTKGYLLDVFVPYSIKQSKCSSTFDKTSKILTLTMPLLGG